jgi:hypothetical protein
MLQHRLLATLTSIALALLCITSPAKATDADFDALLAKYVRTGSDGVNRVDCELEGFGPGSVAAERVHCSPCGGWAIEDGAR